MNYICLHLILLFISLLYTMKCFCLGLRAFKLTIHFSLNYNFYIEAPKGRQHIFYFKLKVFTKLNSSTNLLSQLFTFIFVYIIYIFLFYSFTTVFYTLVSNHYISNINILTLSVNYACQLVLGIYYQYFTILYFICIFACIFLSCY